MALTPSRDCRRQSGRDGLRRHGSPLLLGLGIEENFFASDVSALLPVTQKVIYLEEGRSRPAGR